MEPGETVRIQATPTVPVRLAMVIGGFQPFTLSDFPGKSAAIVFTQGCNFRCPFCHNRPLWPMTAAAPPDQPLPSVMGFLEQRRNRLGGVVVTGGEPTLQPDLANFLRDLKEMGFAVKLDTNGSRPEVIAGLLEKGLVDYVAMDIKAPSEKYHLLSGVKVDLAAIRQSVEIIATSHVLHHFRTTYFQPMLSTEDLMAVKSILPSQSMHIVQAYRKPFSNVSAAVTPMKTNNLSNG